MAVKLGALQKGIEIEFVKSSTRRPCFATNEVGGCARAVRRDIPAGHSARSVRSRADCVA
jgi:hypothetical protein